MLNLKSTSSSYLLASSDNINGLVSYLYSRDYHLIDLKGYYGGQFENCVIGFTTNSPDELRLDAIHIMDNFNQNSIIIKYKGDDSIRKILNDGQEKPMGIIMYNTDSENKSYIYEGLSFSFVEKQLYYFPSKKDEFKKGMVVEYFNQDKWIKKSVINPETEYENMYNLLIKYNKIRIPV